LIANNQGIDIDASNPASRLMLTILAGVAEFERGDYSRAYRFRRAASQSLW
jgi:DNA invertase Pin-like site-specific DNA recombinase